MKAADITDEQIYDFVDSRRPDGFAFSSYDIIAGLPQFPRKVVMAKLTQMVNKKRLDGCACGCRGDFARR